MQENRISFENLPKKDQVRLCAVYGSQPKNGYTAYRIEYVRELTPYEAWFFGRGNFLSPSFLTQTLYKLKGTLSPLLFNRILRDYEAQEDVLRTNYCDIGDRVLAVVTKERKNTEPVIYNNLQGREPEEIDEMLSKFSAAEIRYPFDVEKGGLHRIFVFHTGPDEYAVLVTAAQIILDRFDIRKIFSQLLNLPEVEYSEVKPVLQSGHMESKMHEYWKKLLAAPPRSNALPWELENAPQHSYKQRARNIVLSGELFSSLVEESKGNRMMMMAILATAWGLLLQTEGRLKDLCICLLVPNQNMQKEEAWRPFSMVPVRQTLANDDTIDNLIKRQFQQMLVSRPYACLDWESFETFLGKGKKPFNHFLDFYDFLSEEKPYSQQSAEANGGVVSRRSWDSRSTKLSLYFQYTKTKASIIMLYDEASFPPGIGDRIAKTYTLLLMQMLTDIHKPVDVIQENLLARLHSEKSMQAVYKEEEKARLQHAVSTVQILQGASSGTTQHFVQAGTLRTYFEGDRIEGTDRDFLFVAEGKLARSIEDGEGWYCTLDIVKDGAWINETVMLEERKATLSVEVLSERAEILVVSKEAMENILTQHPSLYKKIITYAVSQLEKYQRLWAQS